eukprot:scaffold4767_cov47-Cyclotella_meneghiniana.AAC.4
MQYQTNTRSISVSPSTDNLDNSFFKSTHSKQLHLSIAPHGGTSRLATRRSYKKVGSSDLAYYDPICVKSKVTYQKDYVSAALQVVN